MQCTPAYTLGIKYIRLQLLENLLGLVLIISFLISGCYTRVETTDQIKWLFGPMSRGNQM